MSPYDFIKDDDYNFMGDVRHVFENSSTFEAFCKELNREPNRELAIFWELMTDAHNDGYERGRKAARKALKDDIASYVNRL